MVQDDLIHKNSDAWNKLLDNHKQASEKPKELAQKKDEAGSGASVSQTGGGTTAPKVRPS